MTMSKGYIGDWFYFYADRDKKSRYIVTLYSPIRGIKGMVLPKGHGFLLKHLQDDLHRLSVYRKCTSWAEMEGMEDLVKVYSSITAKAETAILEIPFIVKLIPEE